MGGQQPKHHRLLPIFQLIENFGDVGRGQFVHDLAQVVILTRLDHRFDIGLNGSAKHGPSPFAILNPGSTSQRPPMLSHRPGGESS